MLCDLQGRTARAGRSGRAITFVTQCDIEFVQRIEKRAQRFATIIRSDRFLQ